MDVFVLSRSRWQSSDTLNSLGSFAAGVRLVVPEGQAGGYALLAARHGCELTSCPHDGIAATRRFCGEVSRADRFLMLDDDLKFYRRVSADDPRLRYPADLGDSVGSMLDAVRDSLRRYCHVSVSAREGNNRLPAEGVTCSRPLRALAYRRREFLSVEHGRVLVMEDFDVTMQLLRAGRKNHVIAWWAQGQKQTQAAGGCSDYRTKIVHEAEVRKFAALHAPFVRLRDKANKTGGDFGTRLEATIYWQRAWESSQTAGQPTTRSS